MNRITKTLEDYRQTGKKAFVGYIVNGDPKPEMTLDAMHAMVESGIDIIELGVPFSDPMAEGPTIQRGHERALAHRVSLKDTIELVAQFRKVNPKTPVILMGYANPVERMGYQTFAELAAKAGVDGLLTVDLPPEESQKLNAILSAVDLVTISLIAPTTTPDRIQQIAESSSGFLYYVSLKGVTGAGHLDIAAVERNVALIREKSSLPVLVGFGIKDAESAQAVGKAADGVIVGSLLVDTLGNNSDKTSSELCSLLKDKVSPIRAALNELGN